MINAIVVYSLRATSTLFPILHPEPSTATRTTSEIYSPLDTNFKSLLIRKAESIFQKREMEKMTWSERSLQTLISSPIGRSTWMSIFKPLVVLEALFRLRRKSTKAQLMKETGVFSISATLQVWNANSIALVNCVRWISNLTILPTPVQIIAPGNINHFTTVLENHLWKT